MVATLEVQNNEARGLGTKAGEKTALFRTRAALLKPRHNMKFPCIATTTTTTNSTSAWLIEPSVKLGTCNCDVSVLQAAGLGSKSVQCRTVLNAPHIVIGVLHIPETDSSLEGA